MSKKNKLKFRSQPLVDSSKHKDPEWWNSLVAEYGEEKVMQVEGITKKQLNSLRGLNIPFKQQLTAAFKEKRLNKDV